MKGRSTVLLLVAMAAMLIVSAVAFANDEFGDRVPGTKDADELTMLDGNDRVYARGGDDTVDGGGGDDRIRGGRGDDALFGGNGEDRLKGGQDNDYLDGGDGDDVLNGRGDGDKDKIVCGDGYDVVKLGRGDVVLVEVGASEYSDEAPDGHEEPDVERPEPGEDDGCEKVQRPKDDVEKHNPCAANSSGCEEREPCAARSTPYCHEPDPCAARSTTYCDEPDPCAVRSTTYCPEPEPDVPAEEPEPDTP